MYICVCKGITEEKAKIALKSGRSIKEVMKNLGIGKDCGTCLSYALECLQAKGQSGLSNSHSAPQNICSEKK